MIVRLGAKEPSQRVELHHNYQQQQQQQQQQQASEEEETINYKLPESTKQTNCNSNPMKSIKMMSLRNVRMPAQVADKEATKEQRDSFAITTTNNNHDDAATKIEFNEASSEAPEDLDQEQQQQQQQQQQQSATQQTDFKNRLKNIVIAVLAKKKETKMENLEAMINESAMKLLQQKELVFKQASCLQLDQLCKTTKFSRRELKWLYLGWKVACTEGCGQNTEVMGGSDNSYGIINEQQFQQIYAQFFPYGGDCSFYAKYVFQAMFSETLVENGGFITFADYAQALSQLLRGTIDEKIDFVFRLYDLNNDNVITLDELSRIFLAVYRLLGDNVNMKHDQLTYEQQAERLYNKIDSDQSGQITREQFVAYCKRDSAIVDTIQSLEMSICPNA